MTTALLLIGGAFCVALIVWLLRSMVRKTEPAHDGGDGDVDSVATATEQILALGGASSIDDDHQPWDAAKFEDH